MDTITIDTNTTDFTAWGRIITDQSALAVIQLFSRYNRRTWLGLVARGPVAYQLRLLNRP